MRFKSCQMQENIYVALYHMQENTYRMKETIFMHAKKVYVRIIINIYHSVEFLVVSRKKLILNL